jgi:hypothetical protein
MTCHSEARVRDEAAGEVWECVAVAGDDELVDACGGAVVAACCWSADCWRSVRTS